MLGDFLVALRALLSDNLRTLIEFLGRDALVLSE